jgi:hypothetical protein
MKVKVFNGRYGKKTVNGVTFEALGNPAIGKDGYYISVKPNKSVGNLACDRIRIKIDSPNDVKHLEKTISVAELEVKESKETDEQIIKRITERFDILTEMTKASIATDVKAMIVSGPPGIGKSYGVEKELEKASMFDVISNVAPKYEVVKGAMTALGLYSKLFQHSAHGNVIVFDDCDAVLQDDLSLNLLKAALDSGKRRVVCWNADSNLLRREGIPNSFDFKGSVVFITNLKFENVKSKKLQDHLAALQSRCHYLDLTLDSMRDKHLRVKQIHATGELFTSYRFDEEIGNEIIKFMGDNKDELREMSLRMALKIADLVLVSKDRWKVLAMNTCMKSSF